VRRELIAELGEVGASAAAAAAAAASAASAAAPTETPPRPKRARKSIQRFDPVQAERGGGGCRPLYPNFLAPPAGPLQAAEAIAASARFLIKHDKCQGRDWWTPFFEVQVVLCITIIVSVSNFKE